MGAQTQGRTPSRRDQEQMLTMVPFKNFNFEERIFSNDGKLHWVVAHRAP
jgi:hypothetical protein